MPLIFAWAVRCFLGVARSCFIAWRGEAGGLFVALNDVQAYGKGKYWL
jgi:hypothetical protein